MKSLSTLAFIAALTVGASLTGISNKSESIVGKLPDEKRRNAPVTALELVTDKSV